MDLNRVKDMKKKTLKIAVVALAALMALVLLTYAGLWIARAITYRTYLADKDVVCKIPALRDGFVAQGISYVDGDGGYVYSGYWGEELSLSYINGEDVRVFSLLDETGAIAKGHGGGITVYGDYVYIADNNSLRVYSLSDLLAAKDGDSLACVTRIPVDSQASFCFAQNGKMFVGEFYRPEVYETDMAHAYTTPEGEANRAIVSCYTILEDGMLEEIPDYWISLPSQVQGFVIDENGVIALSRSWGLSSSLIEFYDGMRETGITAPYADKEVPLYYIGAENLMQSIKAPAFSEGLDLVDGRIVISYESACNKYIVGKFFFAYHAESYPIPTK